MNQFRLTSTVAAVVTSPCVLPSRLLLAFAMCGMLAGHAAVAQPCAADAAVRRLPTLVGVTVSHDVANALLAEAKAEHLEESLSAAPRRFGSSVMLLGELMFERVDITVSTAPFPPAELLPYAHQFRGDMMAAPWTVQVGWLGTAPLLASANRRPGAPPAAPVLRFLQVALDARGQEAIRHAGGRPLDAADLDRQRAALAGFVPPLDPALPPPASNQAIAGSIRSVGSDGLKSLMDSWMCRLHALHPAVQAGFPWEHLGTLNGWNALLVGEADVAPMGRELWPQERAAWHDAFPAARPPLEIMIARGGYDTPQRTTAQAVFVNPANPLRAISMEQLGKVFSGQTTRWGQLGLGDGWADRPIHLVTPPLAAPNSMSMQAMVLEGRPWRGDAAPGSIADTAQAILDDPAAIGFGGLEEGVPGLVALAVAPRGGAPIRLEAETVASGRYPLTRGMFLRLPPGPVSPALAALIDLALSRDGQARVVASAYLPLSAAEAERERAKLAAYQEENRP